MKSDILYISIPAIIKDTVANVQEDFIVSKSNLGVDYFNWDIREYKMVSTSPTFNIRTNFEYIEPEFNSGVEIII